MKVFFCFKNDNIVSAAYFKAVFVAGLAVAVKKPVGESIVGAVIASGFIEFGIKFRFKICVKIFCRNSFRRFGLCLLHGLFFGKVVSGASGNEVVFISYSVIFVLVFFIACVNVRS